MVNNILTMDKFKFTILIFLVSLLLASPVLGDITGSSVDDVNIFGPKRGNSI